jgi:hypothetical protein
MNRARVRLDNFPGAPGLSTFYFGSGVTDMTGLKNFYNAIKDLFPLTLGSTIPNNGDQINENDGKITGVWSGSGGGGAVSAAASASYSGATGLVIDWLTGGIVNGHRVMGRTYIVPGANAIYDTQGSINTTTINAVGTAVNALLASYVDGMKVWSRPYDPPSDGKPHPPARVGSMHTITSARIPDLAVTMRSRRI